MTKYLQIDDVIAYKKAHDLSNYVWDIATKWNILAQKTIGVQFIRSTDSISANMAEGFGRQTRNDKVKFYYYARASVYESLDWDKKARCRNLITEEQFDYLKNVLESLPRDINTHIKLTYSQLSK